ncbi:PepSY domain-containing protein [Streptomyces sp. ML-6]|uniref:PepSY domain-containing protein n=1 Tax=unclassified Streptomyces TaxID=2593676 RepID=UPI0024C07A2A|nr:PepSY domain-containing protein [Streptomyces sp. ML-6]MDK0522281.1 PepSY domain-containing protein [Streptomyces sp. ML-6]
MKHRIVIAAVAAAVLVGGGAAGAVAFADDDGHDREVRSSSATGDAPARVSVQDAVAAALKAVPGTVTGAELDDEDRGPVWEVDVYGSDKVWHDVTVDAGNGKVLGEHTDDDGDDRDRHAPRSAAVSLDSATGAALKAAPGTVTSVDLDGDRDGRGATHWEVEVRGDDGKEHELDVDARTGKVTADRPDDDGHDDD